MGVDHYARLRAHFPYRLSIALVDDGDGEDEGDDKGTYGGDCGGDWCKEFFLVGRVEK